MTRISRRGALGTTVALCHLPVQAEVPGDTQTRHAIDTYARAWEQGDVPGLLACYHPDFTLNYFGRNALAGRHAGKAASTKVLGAMRERTDRKLKGILATLVGGDQAVLVTRETLVAKGQTVEVERVYRHTVADGRLRECRVYDQDQRQLDEIIGA